MSEAEQEKYKAEMISAPSIVQARGMRPTSEKKFHDLVDQIAWDTYKRLEPRYSDANRRLAK